MTALRKLTIVETKLFIRDPIGWLIALILPTVVLLIVGATMGTGEPDPALGGYRFLDIFVPSLLVLTIATLAIHTFSTPLATYREKGILRRLSTVPVRPVSLIVAQVAIRIVVTLAGLVLLIVAANLAYDVPLPKHIFGFMLAVALGTSAMFAVALLIAAIAPTTGAANAIGLPVFFAVMFVGGVYLPRVFLPQIVNDIGRFTPPGVDGITHAWLGAGPDPLALGIMAAITVAAGLLAARLFRWQ
jgi:ABC-2 type transport system permease protein